MKGRILRRRTRSRATGAGYTLIELMVVVLLVALLAAMAAPSMARARADRMAFAIARDVAGVVHNSRVTAAGHGGATLVVFMSSDTAGQGSRGTVVSFEATDLPPPPPAPALAPGITPFPGCRRPNQWDFATVWTPNGTDSTNKAAQILHGGAVTANTSNTGAEIIVQENIFMTARFATSTASTLPTGPVAFFALCTTPNGTTYFGQGASVAAAITAMQQSTTPFTDIVEIDVARHDAAGQVVGLNRRVIITGSSAPRIKSE